VADGNGRYPDHAASRDDDDQTRLTYNIEFSLMGKLGTLGYPMIKHKAGEMSKMFADNLRKELARADS
jgi:carbon monoxide dehydrogenase subunit G